jgi:hypothetical protein
LSGICLVIIQLGWRSRQSPPLQPREHARGARHTGVSDGRCRLD